MPLIYKIRALLFLSVLPLLLSCGNSSTAPTATEPTTTTVSLALHLPSDTAVTAHAEIIVSAADMTSIRHPLTINDHQIIGSLTDIPAGTQRYFTVNTYDAEGNLLATGTAQLDLVPGPTVPLTLTLAAVPALVSPRAEIFAELVEGIFIKMVWIEPGRFTMGSPTSEQGRNADEGPRYEVTLTQGFYLSKCEVTQRQWEAVMRERPWAGNAAEVIDAPDHPAVHISWHDVQIFIDQLNAAGDPLYRLPTEAEWEYTARAGTQTMWSFGNEERVLKDYAWYADDQSSINGHHAQEIGLKPPNPWGLHDMHGNVWEWVSDWLGDYTGELQADPGGPTTGTARIFRGGSFKDSVEFTRSAQRCWNAPDQGFSNVGVRLVRIR
jgi:formylglycine-generating enzyme required for sulfatase activity